LWGGERTVAFYRTKVKRTGARGYIERACPTFGEKSYGEKNRGKEGTTGKGKRGSPGEWKEKGKLPFCTRLVLQQRKRKG